MDYCAQFEYYYCITHIEYDLVSRILKFSMISSKTEDKKEIMITQIEKIIWDREHTLKNLRELISLRNSENICELDIDPGKCVWNLYLFNLKNVNENTQKEVEIEFGDDLYCWLIAEKVYINNKEI